MTTHQRLLTSYALTLFILGVMVGLFAILGRIAQEFQHRLIVHAAGLPYLPRTGHPSLPVLFRDLSSPGTRVVIAGCAVSLISMAGGAMIWFSGGQPDAPYARTWTRLGRGIALCLLVSMGSAVFVPYADARLLLLVVPGVLALLLFTILVYLIVEQTFFPPDSRPTPDHPILH